MKILVQKPKLKIEELNLYGHKNYQSQSLKRNKKGLVIPCFNVEYELLNNDFQIFLNTNNNYHFCFVNYGSNDNTFAVLKELRRGRENYITIVNCDEKTSKEDAITIGMFYIHERQNLDYVTFINNPFKNYSC
ncbi:hypothetical protein [Lutibacter sp. B1]|uniref:hypothetical protein n=1 Tax=Lutibacter sp. B1 TaxID=2725996 RepID=UPI0014570A4D|nr:hypothetical protein [Lutibacter sp. B1]NLP57524.1 hypothetical protein [Lutibacter sp. B1]